MKIVIFSPVLEMSAISTVNNLVLLALQARKHHVTVVRSECEEYLHLPSKTKVCEVVAWNDIKRVSQLTESADLTIYHIGDNYELHCGGLSWLSRVPGIVCLHDYYLASFFYSMAQQRGRQPVERILNLLYPDYDTEKFFKAKSSEEFLEATVTHTPMSEWIAQMALGMIVHSRWDIQRIMNACPGFVHIQPLPYQKSSAPVENVFLQAVNNPSKFNKFKINRIMHVLTIGHVNSNKRAESIVQAIGYSKNKHRIHYHLAGTVTQDRQRSIQQLADGLNVNVSFWGQVSDIRLTTLIEKTDIITCLRWPAIESASASLIEALLKKRPTIVTNTGFYAELPDHVVFKIDPQNEIHELIRMLDKLIYDIQYKTEEIANHVETAYQWAVENFSVEKYADALIDAEKKIKKQQSIPKIMNYFSNILNSWQHKNISDIYLPNLQIFRC